MSPALIALVTLLTSTGVLAALLLVYPGELSYLSPRLCRWLYDRAADGYEKKWSNAPYESLAFRQMIREFAYSSVTSSEVHRVADLGCGTGAGTRWLEDALPSDTEFVAVDFSPRMLERFRLWTEKQGPELRDRIQMTCGDLRAWARSARGHHFGLVVLLEVGEFVPGFERLLGAGGRVLRTRRGADPDAASWAVVAGFPRPQSIPKGAAAVAGEPWLSMSRSSALGALDMKSYWHENLPTSGVALANPSQAISPLTTQESAQ